MSQAGERCLNILIPVWDLVQPVSRACRQKHNIPSLPCQRAVSATIWAPGRSQLRHGSQEHREHAQMPLVSGFQHSIAASQPHLRCCCCCRPVIDRQPCSLEVCGCTAPFPSFPQHSLLGTPSSNCQHPTCSHVVA